jgi:septal ring factor EnvC (AmiA/AmiB activator)
MTNTDTNGNGNGLPPERAALAEASGKAFALQYQTVAHERDDLAAQLAKVKTDLALAMVANEAMKSEITRMESRMNDLTAVRDEAVAYRAHYEAWFSQLDAQCRAFKPPAVPLIRDIQSDNDSGMG